MDARLYSKAAAAAQPHQYEAWRAAKVAQKMEEERQGRISVARKLPKVCVMCVCVWGGETAATHTAPTRTGCILLLGQGACVGGGGPGAWVVC